MLATTLTCIALIAVAFPTPSGAAPVPVDVSAFATEQMQIEGTTTNFWGPAVEPARQEAYADAANGTRRVQYFDKARMEDTPAGVTSGLLTVELISGQRQMGDTRLVSYPPSTLPVVGDLDNKFPSYRALNAKVFPEHADQTSDVVDLVYKSDGTFTHDAKLGAKPGAAAGIYISDPGGRYAHNIPAALSQYFTVLPKPWQTVMGFPLTEAFWVNVRVHGALVWVLVQPFERRVLSYTPVNAPGFTVEMGNIGQHYYQWRYALAPDATGLSTSTVAADGTNTAPEDNGSLTTTALPVISGVRFGLTSSVTASLSFQTDMPTTSRIRFGTASHSYQTSQEIALAPMQDHRVTLSGLTPKTKYYFVLHAANDGGSSESKEGYFATAPVNGIIAASTQDAGGNPAPDTQPTATTRPTKETRTPKPAIATATDIVTASLRPTSTPRPGASNAPTATDTPRSATATAISVPPTNTTTATAMTIFVPPTSTVAPTAILTAIPGVVLTITQFAVASDGRSLETVRTNGAVLTITFTDTMSADTQHLTVMLRSWTADPDNLRIVAADAGASLTLRGRQNSVTVRLDVSVPIDNGEPLAFTVMQTVAPSDYQTGKTYIITKGIAALPGYHVDIRFTVAQG